MIKRISFSFAISSLCGLVVYMLLEWIVGIWIGIEGFSALTPEFLALFPSETLALETAVLLHGVIGAAFAGASAIYERLEIGFVLQNMIYVAVTGLVWIPIVSLVWQLFRYPPAMFGTVCGFVITYVIMSIVGFRMTKKEIEEINECLEMNS